MRCNILFKCNQKKNTIYTITKENISLEYKQIWWIWNSSENKRYRLDRIIKIKLFRLSNKLKIF